VVAEAARLKRRGHAGWHPFKHVKGSSSQRTRFGAVPAGGNGLGGVPGTNHAAAGEIAAEDDVISHDDAPRPRLP
jgi:hypothetical protein